MKRIMVVVFCVLSDVYELFLPRNRLLDTQSLTYIRYIRYRVVRICVSSTSQQSAGSHNQKAGSRVPTSTDLSVEVRIFSKIYGFLDFRTGFFFKKDHFYRFYSLIFTPLRSRRVVMCLVVVFVRSFPHRITSI